MRGATPDGSGGALDVERTHLRRILLRRSIAGRKLRIHCASVNAIRYRDVLELALTLSRVRDWQWIDVHGRVKPRQGFLRNVVSLVRDAAMWPALYRRLSRSVGRLEKLADSRSTLAARPAALYLRTDHWFGLLAGGSVGHTRGVCTGLREYGYTTHVVTSADIGGLGPVGAVTTVEPVYDVGRNLPEVPELLSGDSCIAAVDANWSEWSPSFIYQRYSLGDTTGLRLKEKHGVPLVCEYNGSEVWVARRWGGRRLFHERLLERIELANVRGADVVVVVSQALRDELVQRGVAADSILVNPNGVDPDKYSPSISGSEVRRRYGLGDTTVVGFIGTFGPWHGAEVLAEAFGKLLLARPALRERTRLLMIGDGPGAAPARSVLAALHASDAAIFAGLVPQDEGPAHLAACDLLVSPHVPNPDRTAFFGSPTKLFEYMAMGKGIVASELGQIAEVLRHGETALLVPPGDVDALVLGMIALIDDPALRGRLGARARDHVVSNFTWRDHTRKIIEKLKERCA